jgi:DNA-binding winged helix-turn-helix (wHTH) protein
MSKDENLEQVWGVRIASDGTFNTRFNAARKVVDDDGKA